MESQKARRHGPGGLPPGGGARGQTLVEGGRGLPEPREQDENRGRALRPNPP